LKVPSHILEARIRCPRCRAIFSKKPSSEVQNAPPPPAAPDETEPEPSPPPGPLLTSPHPCHQCKRPIAEAFNKQATTVQCPWCKYRTSIYAVLYHCPSCGSLLESPSSYEGVGETCPACQKRIQVPRNLLQAVPPRDVTDAWFGFNCPNCFKSVVAKKEDVETRVVCPHCLVVLDVPPLGYHLDGAKSSTPSDPLESLHKGAETKCPWCLASVSKNCETCPRCGSDLTQNTR
jgi:DNA-directed RNA polymerase subunit RPC12/RpoP